MYVSAIREYTRIVHDTVIYSSEHLVLAKLCMTAPRVPITYSTSNSTMEHLTTGAVRRRSVVGEQHRGL